MIPTPWAAALDLACGLALGVVTAVQDPKQRIKSTNKWLLTLAVLLCLGGLIYLDIALARRDLGGFTCISLGLMDVGMGVKFFRNRRRRIPNYGWFFMSAAIIEIGIFDVSLKYFGNWDFFRHSLLPLWLGLGLLIALSAGAVIAWAISYFASDEQNSASAIEH